MCGVILASLSCTTVELLIFVYSITGRLIFVQIRVLVLVARSLCYYDETEASFVFDNVWLQTC